MSTNLSLFSRLLSFFQFVFGVSSSFFVALPELRMDPPSWTQERARPSIFFQLNRSLLIGCNYPVNSLVFYTFISTKKTDPTFWVKKNIYFILRFDLDLFDLQHFRSKCQKDALRPFLSSLKPRKAFCSLGKLQKKIINNCIFIVFLYLTKN